MESFTTHIGRVVTGEELKAALSAVADDWAQLAIAIHREDCYAPHVTLEQRDEYLIEMLKDAEDIRAGHVRSFTIRQRINTKLTGECVALFS